MPIKYPEEVKVNAIERNLKIKELNISDEVAIEGWKNIARIFSVSRRMMMARKNELRACGAIFYVTKGRPKHKVVCAFPSVLKAWMAKKSSQGENL